MIVHIARHTRMNNKQTKQRTLKEIVLNEILVKNYFIPAFSRLLSIVSIAIDNVSFSRNRRD